MTPARILLCAVLSGVFFASIAEAGNTPVLRFRSGAVTAGDPTPHPRPYHAAADTIRVLAAMVQFQKDNDNGTTGDGTFVLTPSSVKTVDPSPHNRQYFADHLTFLSNYFSRVSKKRVIITGRVLDSVYTLPSTMRSYSPSKGASNLALATLARDTWRKVDSIGGVDFTKYDCFVIFHAGVGRDLDLASALGSDPGPADIPSIYLGPSALTSLLGGGITVNNGATKISNTIIMPETESRSIAGIGGDFLLALGMNGMLCSSFGSYLGLPDLFDTNTGRSGIGRFGLMDGESIFSWSGLFPPEPSAWEKYWLGWIQPITVPSGTSLLTLPAVALADTVFRIPISQDEYFLLENRNRDPERKGQHITVRNGADSSVIAFRRDTTGLNAFDISSINGVVLDVQYPDWSLPGGVANDGTFYDGGTLIWHIDETVIASTVAADAVNADPDHRGVNLLEADGSKDIGQSYGSFTAGSGSEPGTELDMWYSGNPSPIYKNRLNSTTMPDSRSNSGADSHITIFEFSASGPRMSATVVRGDEKVRVIAGMPASPGEQIEFSSVTAYVDTRQTPADPTSVFATGNGRLIGAKAGAPLSFIPAVTEGRLYRWAIDSVASTGEFRRDGLFARAGSLNTRFVFPPAVSDLNGDGVQEVVTVQESADSSGGWKLRAFTLKDADHDSLADSFFPPTAIARAISTGPIISNAAPIVVGTTDGYVYAFRSTGELYDSVQAIPGGGVAGIAAYPPLGVMVTGTNGVVTILEDVSSSSIAIHPTIGAAVVGAPAVGSFRKIPAAGGGTVPQFLAALTTVDGKLHLLTALLKDAPGFPVAVDGVKPSTPALADIDGDGVRDIVVFANGTVHAYNVNGISLVGFPVTVPGGAHLVSTPVIEDVDGDGHPEIIGVTDNGLVYAWTGSGKVTRGFPLQASAGLSTALVFPALSGAGHSLGLISASTSTGAISGWLTGNMSGGFSGWSDAWPQYQHDAGHGGLGTTVLAGTALASSFFPKDRVYNWPNPAYGGTTHIRYYLSSDATITIKIMDLAGDLVTQFSGPGVGGFDNEASWDVSGVQSGIYFAHIEASGAGGSGVAVVKIAVVK